MKQRILFAACNPWDPAFELPVMSALKNLGHEVEVCGARLKPFESRLLFRIGRRLFKSRSSYLWNKLLRISIWFTQKRVLRAVKKFKPNIFLAVKAKEVESDTILMLRKMGIVTANWYMEGIWHQSVSILSKVYDYFFVMDEYSVSILRDKGIKSAYFLPHGTRINSDQADIFKDQSERVYDIAFIGTPVPTREKLFGSLAGFNLNIWGPPEWEQTQLKRFYHGRVFGRQLDDVYRKSKIVVNCHPEDGNSTNLRDFESVSNGALLISDYKKALAELFVEKKEIIFYRDPGELPGLVSHYLKNEEERSAIAKAGWIAVLAKHTIESRVGSIMKIIESNVNINRYDK